MPKLLIILAITFLCTSILFSQNRSLDGSMNNLSNPDWGAAGQEISRVMSNGYGDLIASPGMLSAPEARVISNVLFDQTTSIPDAHDVSDYAWAFGQFIDHDITLVNGDPNEQISIPIPAFDPYFDPMGTGTVELIINRSQYDPTTGDAMGNPRVQTNSISAWIDASNVYGSDQIRADWLRTFELGKLKTSVGEFLPFNTTSGEFADPVDVNAPAMAMEGPPVEKYFVAGDIRANEQPTLTALHTLFVREHNRLCDEILTEEPTWSDEQIYQRARKMVGAFIHQITYSEWLPALGVEIDDYMGYSVSTYPNIMNVFSTSAFRIGHSLLNDQLIRLQNDGITIPEGNIGLQDAFFNAQLIMSQGGISPYLQGMATQVMQAMDCQVVNDLRNFMFGAPGEGGLDLVSMNIVRGREHGLPDYNTVRFDLGLPVVESFAEISSDLLVQSQLETLFGTVDNIDSWVGMLAEDHEENSSIGESVHHVLKMQFEYLRDGDRYFFLNDPALSLEDVDEIQNTTLAEIIRRNSEIFLIQDNVFHAMPYDQLVGLTESSQSAFPVLRIAPNPAKDHVILSLSSEIRGDWSIQLMDPHGRLIFDRNVPALSDSGSLRVELDEQLQSGVYLIAVMGSENRYIERLLIR